MHELQEMPVQFLGGEDPLEDELATHACILGWRIPWTEGPGQVQSMVLQSQMRLTYVLQDMYVCVLYYTYIIMCNTRSHIGDLGWSGPSFNL